MIELLATEWERFARPEPALVAELAPWLGRSIAPEPEEPALHFLIRDRRPFEGGIDLHTDAKGRIGRAIFYFEAGPLFTEHQFQQAAGLKSPLALAQIEARYGKPQAVKQGTGRTIRWTYEWGPACRLIFSSLPGSTGLHRVLVERDDVDTAP